jgi:hypothetical protein
MAAKPKLAAETVAAWNGWERVDPFEGEPRLRYHPPLEVPLSRAWSRSAAFLSGLALTGILACGGGADSSSVAVDPEPRLVAVGDQLPLTAHPGVDLAGDLEWEVQEPYGGGLRNSVGESTVYFAPPAAGTYHLVLRAVRADGRRLRQEVAVQVLPIPSLEPAEVQVPPAGTVAFKAAMKGLPRNTVTWAVEEAEGGEITSDGQYQAPSKRGTYHVTATSTLDPGASARATVVVD